MVAQPYSSLNVSCEFNDSFNSLLITVKNVLSICRMVTSGGALVSAGVEQILFSVAGTVLYFDLV